jgi:hypothetical protein
VDEVKKLLEGFADKAAEGLPDADLDAAIDADLARGRLALRRIKRRRRVTGVLCVAAASALVFALGNQGKWWSGGSEVAGPPAAPETAAPAPSTTTAPAVEPKSSGTMSMFGAPVVELVANKQTWRSIDCSLAPKGWTPEAPIAGNRVVLSRPEMRTAEAATKVVLQAAPQARTLSAPRVTATGGRTFQLGTLQGRPAGQVKLADRWLLVELPAGTAEWPDDVLSRFMASCAIN